MYNKTIQYWVQDQLIEFVTDETAYGPQVVAIVNSEVQYLGEALPNLHAAVDCYQRLNNVILSSSEFELVILENALKLIELEGKN